MESSLCDLLRQIELLSKNKEDKISIVSQTGPDESLIIGTNDAVLNFAASIIRSLIDAKSEEFLGLEIKASSKVNEAINPLCLISVDEILILQSNEDVHKLLTHPSYV